MAGSDDPLAAVLGNLRSTFDLDAVAVLRPGESRSATPGAPTWETLGSAGDRAPCDPAGHEQVEIADDAVLVYDGPQLGPDDRRVLAAFVDQLDVALERRRLQAESLELSAVAEADHLRTAILRAVSHDLRTPLSSIKASVSSLLQDDITWSSDERDDFLTMIDEETDRLNLLVGNLLDMSRLEAGVVKPELAPAAPEEVVAAALASISGGAGPRSAIAAAVHRVEVLVPETLPQVWADKALLERALANVVSNALHHAPEDILVLVEGAAVGDRVHLRVVDRGPGVPATMRAELFEPFQRLGDNGSENGVGLGLAVARGFVEAMGAEISLDDTPGGGLTVVISLPIAPTS